MLSSNLAAIIVCMVQLPERGKWLTYFPDNKIILGEPQTFMFHLRANIFNTPEDFLREKLHLTNIIPLLAVSSHADLCRNTVVVKPAY